MDGVWSAEKTTPSAIDAALRHLLEEQHAENESYVPARVLNLVVISDREFRGEIENRLENVGRFHPSRTILCSLDRRRTTIDARATISSDRPGKEGEIAICEESVQIELGEPHLERLDTIVDPLLVPDLATLVWSPHGHPEAVDSLLELADVVLIDSIEEPDPGSVFARAKALLEDAYVVDLAWVRSMPWRERIAATFDPPQWRNSLTEVSSVTVRHHPDSAVSGTLLLGWMVSRLGWEPASLKEEDDGLVGRVKASGRRVRLRLERDTTMPVPGLAGITIETASGLKLSLDRGSGGLTAKRRATGGRESKWTVLGASRGESGILGEGIRQALLREPTYGPALTAAAQMLA